MRIIGGSHKGRTIKMLSSFNDRPTTDFAKESLFNILNNYYYFEDIQVLDLFCGSGGISFEFLSRGSKNVTAVDMNKKYLDFVQNQSKEIFRDQNLITIQADVFEFVKNHKLDYDVIFADPPYKLENVDKIPNLIFLNESLKQDTLFILEHSKYYNFDEFEHFKKQKNYGNVYFSFFCKSDFL